MDQDARRQYLIEWLLAEYPAADRPAVPQGIDRQRHLLRALLNVREPKPVTAEFLTVQDAYLQAVLNEKGSTDGAALTPAEPGLYLWQGDCTTLQTDAIVNAANSAMLGCFCPCHGCIDNAIHTYAGVQLRLECARQMEAQGHPEPVGQVKVTPGYNLPCRYILHTVGPYVGGVPNRADKAALASCYRSCLQAGAQLGLKQVAFCCISTGEFGYPPAAAAKVAVDTVHSYRREHTDAPEVIFNVFKDSDRKLYARLLG